MSDQTMKTKSNEKPSTESYSDLSTASGVASTSFLPKDTYKILHMKTEAVNNYANHKIQSQSKYHYHLTSDKVYGDKKLQLCGQCMSPGNLAQDLKHLNRFMKKSSSTNVSTSMDGSTLTLNTPRKLETNKKKAGLLNSIESDPIEFLVLDLTTDRLVNLPLITLPNDLFKFTQLTRLHLDGNQINRIPDLLGESLLNLTTLTLTGNNLKQLPETMRNLTKLTSLHLANNKFERFPDVVCSLTSIKFLDFCSNRLTNVSPQISSLVELEVFLLFDNVLVELPGEAIGELQALRTLWLGKNKLVKLPRELLKLDLLDWWNGSDLFSNIDGNNELRDPPLDILAKGAEAVRSYFNKSNKE